MVGKCRTSLVEEAYGSKPKLPCPKEPAVLKLLCVVHFLRAVNSLSHCDLLSPHTLCGHLSLGFSELHTHPNLHSPVCVGQTPVIPIERVQIWVCLFLYMSGITPRCDATNFGVFDPCHVALLKQGCANLGGFGAR